MEYQEISQVAQELKSLSRDVSSLRGRISSVIPQVSKSSLISSSNDTPGPGSYRPKGDIGTTPPLAYKSRPKHYSFSKANNPRYQLNQAGLDAPSFTTYNPILQSTKALPKIPGVSKDTSPRLPYIKELSKRSPGPIYDPKYPLGPAFSMRGGNRSMAAKSERSPSPDTYNPEKSLDYIRNRPSFRFGVGERDDYKKFYDKETQNMLRGRAGPGPIYNPKDPTHVVRNMTLGVGRRTNLAMASRSPPVGTYTPVLPKTEKKVSFGRAKRFTSMM